MSLRRECPLHAVVDTDTLRVEWEGQPRLVRLLDVDPEHATFGGSKAATEFGRRMFRWFRDVCCKDVQTVELEFPGEDIEWSNSGKLLAYVHVAGENHNVRLVRDGWSPCFEKYGRPRAYRAEMEAAELRSRAEARGIWAGLGGRADYAEQKRWWQIRAGQVDDYRLAMAMGEDILNTRLDYGDILSRARAGTTAQLFAELCRAYCDPNDGISIQLGSPQQPLTAVFPRAAAALARFLERTFTGVGRPNYLYFNGRLSMSGDRPQIVIERLDQVATHPTRA